MTYSVFPETTFNSVCRLFIRPIYFHCYQNDDFVVRWVQKQKQSPDGLSIRDNTGAMCSTIMTARLMYGVRTIRMLLNNNFLNRIQRGSLSQLNFVEL